MSSMEELSSAQQIDLPEDLIFNEILARLSAQHLIRLKLVSKSWRARISTDSAFIASHLARSNTHDRGNLIAAQSPRRTGRLVIGMYGVARGSTNLFEFDASYVRESPGKPEELFRNAYPFGSCNGLVCLIVLFSDGESVLSLWNPATREFKALPGPTSLPSIPGKDCPGWMDRNATYYFGFDEESQDYKVVRLEQIHRRNADDAVGVAHDVQLYTRRSGRWRQLNKEGGGRLFFDRGQGLVVDGTMYWMFGTSPDYSRLRVLSFDLRNESFGTFHRPCFLDDDHSKYMQLMKWKGFLGAVYVKPGREETQVWLKSKNENRWTKKCVVDPSLGPLMFRGVLGDQLIFKKGHGEKNFLYDLDSHERRGLEGDLGTLNTATVLEHVHSLVSPHL